MTDDAGEGADPGPSPEELHTVAPVEDWPWLPTLATHSLAKHPYCEECGLVRVVGPESGLDKGALVNLIARLDRRLRDDGRKLVEAQRRLVLKEMESRGVVDGFATPLGAQIEHLTEIVADYCGWDERYVAEKLGMPATGGP